MLAFREGHTIAFPATITADFVDRFAALSGDCAPLHMDDAFARQRGFPGRVVHGVALEMLLSRLVGMHLERDNELLLSIQSKFLAPAQIGDQLMVEATVEQISEATNLMIIKAKIYSADGARTLVTAKIHVGFDIRHTPAAPGQS